MCSRGELSHEVSLLFFVVAVFPLPLGLYRHRNQIFTRDDLAAANCPMHTLIFSQQPDAIP